MIAARYPDRIVHVVGDAAYVGERLRDLHGRITWTSRLKVTSVLHELPPPRTGRSGRPRTRGPRLGTPTDLATSAILRERWRDTRVRRYGRTDTVQILEVACLWYGSFCSRTVRVILVCDDKPRIRDRDDRGSRLPLVTTDLESTAEDLVARYASRWGIEQAFADARHIMGVGQARNRTRRAVERTVPFGLICLSLVTVWSALHGHAPDDVTGHRARARWYTKTEPSYDDMTIKLRRVIIAARFRGPCPEQATRKKPGPSSQPGPPPGLDQRLHHRHPGGHAHRQQPLARNTGDVGHRQLDLLRQLGQPGGVGSVSEMNGSYGLHGGPLPSFEVFLAVHPKTYRTAGLR